MREFLEIIYVICSHQVLQLEVKGVQNEISIYAIA